MIDVIIPAYNCNPQTFKKCIESIVEQTIYDQIQITVIATGLEDESIPTNKTVSSYGSFSGKYVKPVTPNISLKNVATKPVSEGINVIPGYQNPTANAGTAYRPATGISNPGDIRSNVVDKPLKIPDFLQKK